jgi:ferredoxin
VSAARDQRPAPDPPVPGGPVVLAREGLDALIAALSADGYEVKGPVVVEGAIMTGRLGSTRDLPVGRRDEQSPGGYRLTDQHDAELFGWAVGPGSWKPEFFPASQEVWRTARGDATAVFVEPDRARAPLAIVGMRPCDLAGLDVLDRVLGDGAYADPRYARRRDGCFLVVAECGRPGGTCFCDSMATGPGVEAGYDVALTELVDGEATYLARSGSARGASLLSRLPQRPASARDVAAREDVLARARGAMGRRLDTEGLAERLSANTAHPRFESVAGRCLACANCTLVCPTCFCADVRDTSDLAGTMIRQRAWSSCFDLNHSYLHGGAVRASRSSRYRQWLTHKLSTWWDQFATSGCVGCGRCVTWCPVGIDITEEADAIRDPTPSRVETPSRSRS